MCEGPRQRHEQELLEQRLCLTWSMMRVTSTTALIGFVERLWKMNHSTDVASLCVCYGREEKNLMRLLPKREEVNENSRFQSENSEIRLKLLSSRFLWLFLCWGFSGEVVAGSSRILFFQKTSLFVKHTMISWRSAPLYLPLSLQMKFRTCSQRDRTSCILPLRRNLKAAMNNLSIWEESALHTRLIFLSRHEVQEQVKIEYTDPFFLFFWEIFHEAVFFFQANVPWLSLSISQVIDEDDI